MRKFYLIILFFVSKVLVGQDFNYLPSELDGHQVLVYDHFTISYNEEHEQADWVAYELTKEEVEMDGERCENCFESDENVTSKSATLSDYSSSGFDRGHLAPSADFYMSIEANKETFLMSNMSPQSPSLNREIWADLESWVRNKAIEYEKLYVITGPVFKNNWGTIGNNKVTIPAYFFKAILRFNPDGKVKTVGFLLPNIGAYGNIEDYIVPINLLETITGLDFFPDLASSVENLNESQYEPSSWGF